jgi:hypothetical protein
MQFTPLQRLRSIRQLHYKIRYLEIFFKSDPRYRCIFKSSGLSDPVHDVGVTLNLVRFIIAMFVGGVWMRNLCGRSMDLGMGKICEVIVGY